MLSVGLLSSTIRSVQGLPTQLIQGGRVDELILVISVVHLLHSVWVALSIVECVAGRWLIGLA